MNRNVNSSSQRMSRTSSQTDIKNLSISGLKNSSKSHLASFKSKNTQQYCKHQILSRNRESTLKHSLKKGVCETPFGWIEKPDINSEKFDKDFVKYVFGKEWEELDIDEPKENASFQQLNDQSIHVSKLDDYSSIHKDTLLQLLDKSDWGNYTQKKDFSAPTTISDLLSLMELLKEKISNSALTKENKAKSIELLKKLKQVIKPDLIPKGNKKSYVRNSVSSKVVVSMRKKFVR